MTHPTTWNVELHSHTYYSKDCLVRFEDIIRICEQRGVDKIAITDHNTADGALAFQKIAPELVIVGEEVFTTKGEILAYYVKETVPKGLSPQETIDILRDQGAVISVSHPFDPYRKGAWRENDLLDIIDQVDAIEIYNARCLQASHNENAHRFAAKHGVLGTIGSDAHSQMEYGTAIQAMNPFYDAASFLESLKTAKPNPALSPFYVHFTSTFAKWSRKLGFIARAP
jgi:predicted metal-dependent phosphoesterase TrpH